MTAKTDGSFQSGAVRGVRALSSGSTAWHMTDETHARYLNTTPR